MKVALQWSGKSFKSPKRKNNTGLVLPNLCFVGLSGVLVALGFPADPHEYKLCRANEVNTKHVYCVLCSDCDLVERDCVQKLNKSEFLFEKGIKKIKRFSKSEIKK